MIISSTPFRISLIGGGTDLPEYYKKFGGKVIGFAINKYCNIFFRYGNSLMEYNFRIAYSKIELVNQIAHINHPSVREVSKFYNIKQPYDLLHNGDLPAKTGLGSSSSFTVGMCKIFRNLKKLDEDPYQLAKDAIFIEQEKIKESVGSQDQILSAFGGFNKIDFTDKKIVVKKILLETRKIKQISNNFLLMYTGIVRYADVIEKSKIIHLDKKLRFYESIKSLVDKIEDCFTQKLYLDLKIIGEILDYSWDLKKNLSSKVSNSFLDQIYIEAKKQGAYGGKILGAGGGGFFLFVVPSNKLLNFKKYFKKFKFVDYSISSRGSTIIYNE
jgi:D-glycero-alpha-D-manno-heptose-7-phosphate kinase